MPLCHRLILKCIQIYFDKGYRSSRPQYLPIYMPDAYYFPWANGHVGYCFGPGNNLARCHIKIINSRDFDERLGLS